MRSSLTLAQLRLLDALARSGSITRAARALSVSQPSVSSQLRGLENRYRLRLFARDGHRLEPTEEGEALLPRIRALLALADEIEGALNGVRELEQGRLRVGYSTHQFVMRVLGSFMDRHRGIRIEARSMASFDLLKQLRGGEIDAAFVTLPTPEAELALLELRREAVVLMAPKDHPLSGSGRIALKALAGQRLVQREPSSGTRRALEGAAARAGIGLQSVLDLGSWESMRAGVLGGIGLGVAMAGELGSDPEIVAIEVELPGGRALSVGHYLTCLPESRALAAINALFALTETLQESMTEP